MSDLPLYSDDPGYVASRLAMGQTRRLAERLNLAAMTPRGDLASSGYCLADPGGEYLVYVPEGDEVTVDLSEGRGLFAVEWIPLVEGKLIPGEPVRGGARRAVRAPLGGGSALHLVIRKPVEESRGG